MTSLRHPVPVKLTFASSELGWDSNEKECSGVGSISVFENFRKVEVKDYTIR